ncbi:hypothetical protein AAC387_Pa09g0278 [Persea americana]
MALVLGSGHSDVPNSNQSKGNGKSNVERKSANYHPHIWGDRFIKSSIDDLKPDELTQKRANELKEEVKRMLINVNDHLQELNLIDAIQRLGVAYHFETEIAEALLRIYNTYDKEDDSDDLHTVALRFRLLRQEGCNASPKAFNKFIDGESKFKKPLATDIRGLLSLYEAAYMGIPEEDILDEAIAFATEHLSLALPHLESPLSTLVELALELPLRKRVERLQSRYYISIYQQEKAKNNILLEFAKLDFNILQLFHRKELKEISVWWKKWDFGVKLPFIRDRVVECYFWIMGTYFEPQYSQARIITTKIISLASVMDDTYDVYATIDELEPYTDAIQRWDRSAIDQLPEYMKLHFCALLDTVDEFEEELSREGKAYRISYLKEVYKELSKNYYIEQQWAHSGYVPTLEEYMRVALITAAYQMLTLVSYVGMGDVATREAFEWVKNMPKLVQAASIVGRFTDDIQSNQLEQMRGHVASCIQIDMKENGSTYEEACEKFKSLAANAWKDINKECLNPTMVPMPLLMRAKPDELTQKRANELKEEVKRMLINVNDHLQELNLIDAIQRLGVAYHFESEIAEALLRIYNTYDKEDDGDDLHTIALRFRLLRQEGCNASPKAFNKFIDGESKFKKPLATDIRGLLSLYEAAYIGIPEEDILDEAIAFATEHLNLALPHLESPLSTLVELALELPLRKRVERLQSRYYISIYQQEKAKNNILLEFAKLDFNILQLLHRKELKEISVWWKKWDFGVKLPFIRDRVVECYFWIMGTYFEPQYSQARIITTKIILLASVMDDTYDVYATIDELEPYTDAIQRWDRSAIDQLPEYMKLHFCALLDTVDEFEEELSREGKAYRISYLKEVYKELSKNYYIEQQWAHSGYVPTSEEYMRVALITASYQMLTLVSYVGMGDVATREAFEWVKNMPKLVQAASIVCRFKDDIQSNQLEQMRGHVASCIQIDMKENGSTYEEACEKFKSMAANAWKDINKECLNPTMVPMPLLMRAKPDEFTQKRANELKEEVKRMLINVNDHLQELNLIDAIQRLGVAYHFETEIAEALLRIYNTYDKEDDGDDLHTIALRFRLLRQEGCNASPMMDDTYDVYATIEELEPYTDAIQRWDRSAIDQLLEYMKLHFCALLDAVDEFEEELSCEGKAYRISYLKEVYKELSKNYYIEQQWAHSGYVPTLEEYMRVALITAGYHMLTLVSYVGMGDVATTEAFEWVKIMPKLVQAASIVGRFKDDIQSNQKPDELTQKRANELKEEVKRMLINVNDHLQELNLIDAIQRLGVAYHFEIEIAEALLRIYNTYDKEDDSDDLHTVALRFRLLRQEGCNASPKVFNKFIDGESKFKKPLATDIRGLLSLYEAAYMGIPGEDILDEAIAFTTEHLNMALPHLESPLSILVELALELPLRKRVERLQSRWWKKWDFGVKLPFIRDRVVECYFWIMGAYFEPQYSQARIIATKIMLLASVMDDTYDVYATIDELEPYTDAVQRWDRSAIDQLPEYMKLHFCALLDTVDEFEEELSREGKAYRISYLKEVHKELSKNYYIEQQWAHSGYVPTLEEYMRVALITGGYQMLTLVSYVGMGDVATREAFEWVKNMPKLVQAASIVSRFMDDIQSNQLEQMRGHVASCIQIDMKENGSTYEEACEKFKSMAANAWKDINKECLNPTMVPMPLLMRAVNFARVIEVMYQHGDGYTNSTHETKDRISLVLVEPIPM